MLVACVELEMCIVDEERIACRYATPIPMLSVPHTICKVGTLSTCKFKVLSQDEGESKGERRGGNATQNPWSCLGGSRGLRLVSFGASRCFARIYMDFVATYILGYNVSQTRKRGDLEKWRAAASLCGMDTRSCSVDRMC